MSSRVFYPYHLWEGYKHGMYTTKLSDEHVPWCIEVLADCDVFYKAATHVAHNWPLEAEMRLGYHGYNHQAWLGHAACAYLHGAGEESSVLAYRSLTKEYQDAANAVADRVLEEWKAAKCQKSA